MKIAIISPGSFSVPPVIGSSVEHDIQMIAEQLQNEHVVNVYTRKCPEYRRSSKHGNLRYTRFSFANYDIYLTKVLKHLKKWKPDIIMVENRPSYIQRVKKHFPETPVVLNMHSTVFASPPQIQREEMNKAAQATDALITNSQYLKRYYIRKHPAFKGKAHAVHLGINPDPFEKAQEKEEKVEELRSRFKLKEDDLTILFVGRLLKAKGIHLVLDVLPQLVKEYPQLKLVITGSPRYGRIINTPYLRLIRRKAAKLRKHVVFTNFIKPHKIPYVYQLADVVVIPSLWQEPFGRVNLEAMASVKPVVASDRGGIPEVIQHEENGFVISLRDYRTELYQSLSRLLESKDLREAYGQRGLELVREFTWSKTAERYAKIFESLLPCQEEEN